MVALPQRNTIEHIVKEYTTTINAALQQHFFVFLDNIYPKPVEFVSSLNSFNRKNSSHSDPAFINTSTQLLEYWQSVLEEANNVILMPAAICQQAYRGYGVLMRIVAEQQRQGNLGEEVGKALYAYLPKLFALLEETRQHHLFLPSPEAQPEYHNAVDSFVGFTEFLSLKDPGHRPDNHADEKLIAGVVLVSKKANQPAALITGDSGIANIIHHYNEYHVKQCRQEDSVGRVVVYSPPNINSYTPLRTPRLWQR